MRKELSIPSSLKHLSVDERGYPIPYFVAYVNGKPDFRLYDSEKWRLCIKFDKCAICGRKNHPKSYFFIGGELMSKNKVSSDNAMHRACAEFSLQACPHMYFQKADRNDHGDEYKKAQGNNPFLVESKPTAIHLIKADKYWVETIQGARLIQFRKVSEEVYTYQNGVLTKPNQ